MTRQLDRTWSSAGRPTPRPLAISLDPVPGESLIGLVARATRLNVLDQTCIILGECAPALLHPGTIGQDIFDPRRLAVQLGCSTGDILERCHPYLGDPEGPADVRWGRGALFRAHIVTINRQVSPATLTTSEHHRSAWMNRLLPYCPQSLELLINTCATCGKTQGWRHSWGIGFCDDRDCRSLLMHPTGEHLPDQLAEGYRRFAGIVSAAPAEREAAVSQLHPDLAALPPAVLINLALQAGAAMQETPGNFHRAAVSKLPALTIATIAARGASLLLDWPNSFRASIAERLASSEAADPNMRRALLQRVRRLGFPNVARAEQVAVVRDAVPEAFEHAIIALEGLVKPVVPANVICRSTNISPRELNSIREAGFIKHRVIAAGRRMQVQYDKADADELARCQRESIFASRLEQRFGLPRYAVEQIVCLGEIEREAHPALALIHPTLRLVEKSVEAFASDLERRAKSKAGSAGLIPLGTASRVLGGRPKPWGAILSAMRAGALPFWLAAEGKFVRRALVRPADILQFAAIEFDERDWPELSFRQTYTQVDAAEILNLDALQIRRLIQAGDLTFEPEGVAMITNRVRVLRIAASHLATAEISFRTGVKFIKVPRLMKCYPHIVRTEAGWDRAAFDAEFGTLAAQDQRRQH